MLMVPSPDEQRMSAPQIEHRHADQDGPADSRRLSNWAASTRKIDDQRAKAKLMVSWFAFLGRIGADCERKSWLKPAGNVSFRRSASRKAYRLGPMVTPGIGTAWKVAELSWLYWVSGIGFGALLDGHYGRQRHHLPPAAGADVVFGQPLAASGACVRGTCGMTLVGSVVKVEAVDVVSRRP